MPGLRAYPSAALSGSTGSPEEPLGRHWPLRIHRCAWFLPGGTEAGRRSRVRDDTPHCGWTIRGSAIKVFRYRMQSDGHEVREGGAHHR